MKRVCTRQHQYIIVQRAETDSTFVCLVVPVGGLRRYYWVYLGRAWHFKKKQRLNKGYANTGRLKPCYFLLLPTFKKDCVHS